MVLASGFGSRWSKGGKKKWKKKKKQFAKLNPQHKLKLAKKSRQLPNETTERERGSFDCDSVERERERGENGNEDWRHLRVGSNWMQVMSDAETLWSLAAHPFLSFHPTWIPTHLSLYFSAHLFQPPLQADNTLQPSQREKRMWERERRTSEHQRERGTIGLLIIKWRHGAAERVWSRQLLKPEADSW